MRSSFSVSILLSFDMLHAMVHRSLVSLTIFGLYLTFGVDVLTSNDLERSHDYHIMIQYRFCFHLRYNKLGFIHSEKKSKKVAIFDPPIKTRPTLIEKNGHCTEIAQDLNYCPV